MQKISPMAPWSPSLKIFKCVKVHTFFLVRRSPSISCKYINFSKHIFKLYLHAYFTLAHHGQKVENFQKNVTHVYKIHEKTLKIEVFPNFEGVKDEDVFFSELNLILEGPPFHWYS